MAQIPQTIYGSGADGVKTVSGTETLNVYKSCSGTATDDHVDVASGDEASFSAGDIVILHKARGNTTTNAGTWEICTVDSTEDTLVTFTTNIVNSYQDSGDDQSQIILVPQYTTFSCPSEQILTGTTWGGDVGGFVAICASTSITVAGTIDTDDLGYRAGSASSGTQTGKQGGSHPDEDFDLASGANGGGGGGGEGSDSADGGGGGGGGAYSANGVSGQNGSGSSQNPGGTGGTSYGAADLTTIFFGSAGGGGGSQLDGGQTHGVGGKGGGIIFLISPTVTLSGTITNDGANGGASDFRCGGGGGGAGGSVLIKGDVVTIGTNLIACNKGTGGASPDGGDGGGGSIGRIRVDYGTSVSGSTTTPATSENQDDDLLTITKADNSAIANILAANSQVNSAKVNILVTDNIQDSSAKANINTPQSNSAKADISPTKSQASSAKSNILRTDETQANSAKSDILVENNTDDNSAKAQIVVILTKVNSALVNILSAGQQSNSAKANILRTNETQVNSAKAFMSAIQTKDNSVTASIKSTYFRKRFAYKMYYSDTNIKDVWGDEVLTEPSFRSVINGGVGEVTVQLARKVDAFGEGEDIVLDRKIDIYVYDRDQPAGFLLFRGFLASFSPVLNESQEYLELIILGYVVESGLRILKDSDGYTALQYYSEDPGNIMKDIIEKHQADGGHLSYTDSTIDLTSTIATYTFNVNTVKQAMEKTVELAPEGWYFRIDPDGVVYFKEKSTTADHKLYIGKDIFYMKPEKRIDNLRNVLYFVGGDPAGGPQLYRKYSRTSSITSWGMKEEKWADLRVTLTSTADIKADKWLDEREEPAIRTILKVYDNNGEDSTKGYDIESIQPGDTISIENLKSSQKAIAYWDQSTWDSSRWDYEISGVTSDVLHVISTTYYPDYLEVEASEALPSVSKRIEDIQRNLDDSITATIPTKPVDG